jgi:hypothetical protein
MSGLSVIVDEDDNCSYWIKKSEVEQKLVSRFPFLKKKFFLIHFFTASAILVIKEKKIEKIGKNAILLTEKNYANPVKRIAIEKEEFKKIMGFKEWPNHLGFYYLKNDTIFQAWAEDELFDKNVYCKFLLGNHLNWKVKGFLKEGNK